MKYIFLLIALSVFSIPSFGQSYLRDGTNATSRVGVSNGRLLVDIGTNTTLTGTVNSSTNINIASVGGVAASIGDSNANVTNTVNVKGWPLLVTNLQFSVAVGTSAWNTNGNAITSILQVNNTSTDTNSPSVLLSASYRCNTNCPLVAQVYAHVFAAEPTALGASGLFAPTYSDDANYLGTLCFTNWVAYGATNMVSTAVANNMGVSRGTNWIVVQAGSTWTNNTGGPKDSIRLTYQKAH